MDTPPKPEVPHEVLDTATVAKLVREELERNNRYLEFAQDQIVKDRSFYKHLYTFSGAFIAIIVAVGGYFQYSSFTQMRTDMKESVNAEISRTQAEVAALRAQAAATSAEAQATVGRELTNVRTEVEKRIDTEFKTDNITALVENAARSKTEQQFAGIVQVETSKQVAKAISDQQPLIEKTVQNQTTTAVKALEPTINSTVSREMELQVQRSISPITAQMKSFSDLIAVERLATLAKSNDRAAFDQLLAIVNSPTSGPTSPTEDMRRVAEATVIDISNLMVTELSMGVQFVEGKKPQPDDIRKMMSSSSALERMAALDNYPDTDNRILPMLVQLILTDGNLQVVNRALRRFNILTKQNIHFPDYTSLLQYWTANKDALMKDVK